MNEFATTELLQGRSNYPVKKVHPNDTLGGEAKSLIAHHLETGIDYKRVVAAHWSLGIRHSDISGALETQAAVARQEGDGSENAASRAYHDAAVGHRDAMQRHYDAGNHSDGLAYSTDKIEGGADSQRVPSGAALWATKQAAAASKNADTLTATAEKLHPPSSGTSPLPLVHKAIPVVKPDYMAEHSANMAQAHAGAADLWQQASDAYSTGDTISAKALTTEAQQATSATYNLSGHDDNS